MADRTSYPLSGLRPGGYVDDLTVRAYGRPPLSMPYDGGQSLEATYMGSAFHAPIHGEKLPFGITYESPEYQTLRTWLAARRAAEIGPVSGVAAGKQSFENNAPKAEIINRNAARNIDNLDMLDLNNRIHGGNAAAYFSEKVNAVFEMARARLEMEAAAEAAKRRAAVK